MPKLRVHASSEYKRQLQEDCAGILNVPPEDLAGASVRRILQEVTKYMRSGGDPTWTPPFGVEQFYSEKFDEYIPD